MDGVEDFDRICDVLDELDLDHIEFREWNLNQSLKISKGEVPFGNTPRKFLRSVMKLCIHSMIPAGDWKVHYFNEPGPKCAKHYDSDGKCDYSAYFTESNTLKIYAARSFEPCCWNQDGQIYMGIF